jgi:ABC-2 type transport system permease protein
MYSRAPWEKTKMPIHRERYRRREDGFNLHGRAWLVIAGNGLRMLLRRRAFIILLVMAWIPAIVRGVQIYVAANFPQASFLAVTARTFRDFLEQQELFVFFITVYAGSGLIADDIRANALQLYLSRPVTRTQYIAGKLGVLATALAMATWAPAMVLLLLVPIFAGSTTFVRDNLYLIPAISLFSLVVIGVAAFSMLALSSLSKSRWFVAIMYAGLMFFSVAVFAATEIATDGSGLFSWVAIPINLAQIGDVIFRLDPPYDTHSVVAASVLGFIIAASVLVLRRRIRAIEVVT